MAFHLIYNAGYVVRGYYFNCSDLFLPIGEDAEAGV